MSTAVLVVYVAGIPVVWVVATYLLMRFDPLVADRAGDDWAMALVLGLLAGLVWPLTIAGLVVQAQVRRMLADADRAQ